MNGKPGQFISGKNSSSLRFPWIIRFYFGKMTFAGSMLSLSLLIQVAAAWPSDYQSKSIHRQISEKAVAIIQGRLVSAFLRNAQASIVASTTTLNNDLEAHGNLYRNGGDIQQHFQRFLSLYRDPRREEEAARYLGYCMHLIEDMAVPAHIFNIPHYFPPQRIADNLELAAFNKIDLSGWLTNQALSNPAPSDDPASYYYKEAMAQTQENVISYHVGNYWHAGNGDPWCGALGISGCPDGPAGYYTSLSLDLDLFPALPLPGSNQEAFLKNQLNEAVQCAALFLWSTDLLLSSRNSSENFWYFPRLVQTEAQQTGVAVVNYGKQPAQWSFSVFENDGRLSSSIGLVKNPFTMQLAAGKQFAALAFEMFGNAWRSAGSWLLVQSDQPEASAFFLTFDPSLTAMDGAQAQERVFSSMLFPETAGVECSLVNPLDSRPADITLDFLNNQGVSTSPPIQAQIPPHGRYTAWPERLFGASTIEKGGYLSVRSSVNVAGLSMGLGSSAYLWALPAMDALEGATSLYAPQFVSGYGYRSSIILVNLEMNPAAVSIEWLNDQGLVLGRKVTTSIAAKGRMVLNDSSSFQASLPNAGYLRMQSDRRLAGAVFFGDDAGRQMQTALPLVTQGQKDMIYAQVAQDKTYFTGVAVVNANPGSANLTVSIYDANGALLGSGSRVLAGGARLSQLLSQLVAGLPPLSRGFFRVQSDQPLLGFALFGTHNLSVLSAIPPKEIVSN